MSKNAVGQDGHAIAGRSIRGSLLDDFFKELDQRGVDISILKEKVPRIFGLENASHTNVMLLARDAAMGPDPLISPVSVQLTGAAQSGAQVVGGSAQQALGQSAVLWAGHYISAVGGKLARVLEDNYIGLDRPYNHAVFTAACLQPWPEEIARAAYSMVWLVEVLRSVLAHELKLPGGFPRVHWLVAAGFVPGQAGIAAMPDLIAAISQFQSPGRVRVLYPRRQQTDLASLVAPPDRMDFLPVDEAEDLARAVLIEVIEHLRSREVRDTIRQRFVAALTALLRARSDLREGEFAARGSVFVLTELVQKALVRKREAEYLKLKIDKVGQTAPGALPLASAIRDELDYLRDQWLEEAGIVRLVPVTPDEQPNLDHCHRLWRRLSVFVREEGTFERRDQAELPKDLPKCLQITTLNDNKQDLLYLLGMEGAIDPFNGMHSSPPLEIEARRWFDRLLDLQDLLARVWFEAEEKREEAGSYGTEWKDMLGDQVEQAREALRVLEARVDAYWWDLRRRLGREPTRPDDVVNSASIH